MRGLPLALAVTIAVALSAGAARSARADVGLGLFVGEPFGLSVKFDLQRRSALELLLGATTFRDYRANYAHLTYLVTPVVGRGRSVLVPLRLGVGAAFYDHPAFDFADEVNLAVRAPLQVALMFRNSPLEIYGEISLKVTFLDEYDNNDSVDLDGGVGIRLLL